MEPLVRVLSVLNPLASAAARFFLAPIGWFPAWFSLLLVSIAAACAMLIAFKYTSNQRAIRRVRDSIKANLLAVRLFNHSPRVALLAQGAILADAARLLFLAIIPTFVMLIPITLLITQLSLWYELAPLRPGETTVLFAKFREDTSPIPQVTLSQNDAFKTEIGPFQAPGAPGVAWRIQAAAPGYHTLTLHANSQTYTKELAVGDSPMRVSRLRPGHVLTDMLLYPMERPFAADSAVQSIDLQYAPRTGWATGAGRWPITWFILSMLAAFALRPLFNVQF